MHTETVEDSEEESVANFLIQLEMLMVAFAKATHL